MPEQVTVKQPTQNELRMIFDLALQNCKLQSTQGIILNAATWFEAYWQHNAQKAAVPSISAEDRPKSAVEQFGKNSPEAQSARDKRTAERKRKEAGANLPLPWKDYHKLSPESIVKRLARSKPEKREEVQRYELTHANRMELLQLIADRG